MQISNKDIKNIFTTASELITQFSENHENIDNIVKAGETMVKTINAGGKIISCGNGGSMSDAMHFAEELSGRFKENRPAIPATAISDPGYITCVGNDFGYENIFSRYIEAFGKNGDTLLAISTSGKSENIIKAAQMAKTKNMNIIGLTGNSGGQLADFCDVEIRVPYSGYADRIQEVHIKIIHSLVEYIESSLFFL